MPEDKDKKINSKFKDPNFIGLTYDQFKLFAISMASFGVSTGTLLYFGVRDGTITSGWRFLIYVVFSIVAYYLYYTLLIK